MTFEDYLYKKGQDHVQVLETAHQLLISAHPAIQFQFKWSLPMFTLKKNIAYLDVQKGRPLVGVNYAIEIPGMTSLVEMGERKIIGHFYLDNFNAEKYAELLTIIEMAVSYDLER